MSRVRRQAISAFDFLEKQEKQTLADKLSLLDQFNSREFSIFEIKSQYHLLRESVDAGALFFEKDSRYYIATYTNVIQLDYALTTVMLQAVSDEDLVYLKQIDDIDNVEIQKLLEKKDFDIQEVAQNEERYRWLVSRLQLAMHKLQVTNLIPLTQQSKELLYLLYGSFDFTINIKEYNKKDTAVFRIYEDSREEFILNPPADIADLFLFSKRGQSNSIL